MRCASAPSPPTPALSLAFSAARKSPQSPSLSCPTTISSTRSPSRRFPPSSPVARPSRRLRRAPFVLPLTRTSTRIPKRSRRPSNSSALTAAGRRTARKSTGKRTLSTRNTARAYAKQTRTSMICAAAAGCASSRCPVHTPGWRCVFPVDARPLPLHRSPGLRRSRVPRKLGCVLVHPRLCVDGHGTVAETREQALDVPDHDWRRPSPAQRNDLEQPACNA